MVSKKELRRYVLTNSVRYDGNANLKAVTGHLINKYPENMKHELREHTAFMTDFLMSMVISPRDAASGLPTGKRQHKPFSLTR